MEQSCFLFGHADAPQSIQPWLQAAIEEEISMGTRLFYVGYHGDFDRIAAAALRSAKQHHAEIRAYLLLSYHPAEQAVALPKDFDGSFFP